MPNANQELHIRKKYIKTSLIILSYNGMDHLPECIASLKAQDLSESEIIVIDNGSVDGSTDYIERNHPDISLFKLNRNAGYCEGMNIGVNHSKAEYVFLLNQDIVFQQNALSHIVKILDESDPNCIGAFPKILFHHAPLFINAFGTSWYDSCQWRDTRVGLADFNEMQKIEYVFGSIFPAVLFKRKEFMGIGGFDEMFWSYNEDFDICYRAAIFGFKFLTAPNSKILHKYRASSRDQSDPLWSKYWFIRNYLFVFIKNYELKNLFKYKRILFLRYLGKPLEMAIRKKCKEEAWLYMKIMMELVFKLPRLLLRRRNIQKNRIKDDKSFWSFGKIEEHNIYHVDGHVVLSLKALRAAAKCEKYKYVINHTEFTSI